MFDPWSGLWPALRPLDLRKKYPSVTDRTTQTPRDQGLRPKAAPGDLPNRKEACPAPAQGAPRVAQEQGAVRVPPHLFLVALQHRREEAVLLAGRCWPIMAGAEEVGPGFFLRRPGGLPTQPGADPPPGWVTPPKVRPPEGIS